MDEGQNKNPTDSTGAAPQQGIFSTPELTVDTEKVAQTSAASQESARSRVASIFANTETGRQAQQLNDAMGMNNAQPVDGDIVIKNEPRKKSKLPLILAGVVVVAAVVVGIYVLATRLIGRPSTKTVLTAFDFYGEMLNSGPDGTEECVPPDGLSMIEYLGDFNCSTQQDRDITSSIINAYSDFKSLYDESKFNSDETLRRLVDLQGAYLAVISRYINYSGIEDRLINLYNAGESSITPNQLYSGFDIATDADPGLALFSDTVDSEIANLIAEYHIYSNAGCILSDRLDYECAGLIAETGELDMIYDAQDRLVAKLEEQYSMIAGQVLSGYDRIKELLHEQKK